MANDELQCYQIAILMSALPAFRDDIELLDVS